MRIGMALSIQSAMAANGLFNPATAPGTLGFWSSTGITSGATFTWSDLSGNGRDLTASSSKPTLNASDSNLGGAPSVSFNGSAMLSTPSFGTLNLQAMELWFAGRITVGSTNRIPFQFGPTATNVDAWMLGYNWTSPLSNGPSGLIHSSPTNTWPAFADPGAYKSIGMVYDKSTNPDTVLCYYDGVAQTQVSNAGSGDSANTFGNYPLTVGAQSGLVNPAVMTVGEIWCRGQRSTSAEIAALANRHLALFGV